jgi:peptide/nickel transport system ATP-binding protein
MEVDGLSVQYSTSTGLTQVLKNVSLTLEKGKILGVVGESGSGKSTLGLSMIGLLPVNARITSGEVRLRQRTILSKETAEFGSVRGTGVSMIFQEPLNSLNPVYKVGYQVAEAILVRDAHRNGIQANHLQVKPIDYRNIKKPSKAEMFSSLFSRVKITEEIKKEIVNLLRAVRISDPENVINRYPHELSGGMRQRVMIAISLALKPDVLVADEPTTALDVTTQAKVLFLIKQLATEYNTAVMLISHDLSVVSEVADDCQVMYLGEVVERSSTSTMFSKPLHPYTVGLLGSIPQTYVDEEPLMPIPGSIPDPSNPPSGCSFHTRCPRALDMCRIMVPKPVAIKDTYVMCHLYGDGLTNER